MQPVDYLSPNAAADFTQSIVTTGFAVIDNHPIDPVLMQESYDQWLDFFLHQPKKPFLFDSSSHSGFIPLHQSETAKGYSAKDLKEMYHYYQGGRCPASTQIFTSTLYKQLYSVATTLLNWIEAHTPPSISKQLSEPLSSMIKDSTRTLFRLIHYPPLTSCQQDDANAMRAQAHEDINLITLLPAATAKGLQIFLPQDQTWHDICASPSQLVINIGDMLSECTQNYYRSTTHRVINPTGEDATQSRLSMPLFLHPRDDVRLSARYTAHSYRQERFQEIGLNQNANLTDTT